MSDDQHDAGRDGPAILVGLLWWIVPGLMLASLALRPINLADISTHLKLGEMMLRSGTPYLSERFAINHIGEPLTPSAWLAQGLFHQIHAWFGWSALRAVDGLVWFSGFLVGVASARDRRAFGVLTAFGIAFIVALPTAGIRPQSFASLAFGLTLLLLRRPDWRAVLISVPLFVAWQNLHPSVTIAVAAIGAIAAPQWLSWLLKRGRPPIAVSAMGVIAAASIFATPAGADIMAMAGHNAEASILAGATEWFPLWDPVNQSFLWPVMASAFLVGTVARTLRWAELAPCVITLLFSLLAARFVLFYAITLVPILSSRLAIGPQARPRLVSLTVSCGLAAIALFLAPVQFSPSAKGAAIISEVEGPIYSDPSLGGLIESSTNKVAFDGRFYLYSLDELRAFLRSDSDPSTLQEIERVYHPAGFALARVRSSALIDAIEAQPSVWRKVHADDYAVYYLRAGTR